MMNATTHDGLQNSDQNQPFCRQLPPLFVSNQTFFQLPTIPFSQPHQVTMQRPRYQTIY